MNTSIGDGTPISVAIAHGDYVRRATRYREIDFCLAEHTRFFGAAALITEVLRSLTGTACRVLVSREVRGFLTDLGSDLERLNLRIAQSIERGRLSGGSLDARLVNIEQSRVQQRLRQWQRRSPGRYAKLIGDLDRLLSLLRFPWAVRSAAAIILRDVLGALRATLGRPIQFARQTDREAIGNAIIEVLHARGSARDGSRAVQGGRAGLLSPARPAPTRP